MKIIQSCWACNQSDFLSLNAGWVSAEYHLMSWTLSCLQLKKHYKDVTLYSDKVAAKILIDTLQLPYSELICNMDILNDKHEQLYALPKIYAYSLQNTPFLHVDSDVYLWKLFPLSLINSEIIVQNEENGTLYYETIMKSLEMSLTYFPEEILEDRKNKKSIKAYNCGIFGGNDMQFFKFFTQKAMDFIDKNVNDFNKISVFNFNIFFEQYLLYCLAIKENKKASVLIPEIIEDLGYKGFGDFIEVPYNKQYLHLIGVYKRNKKVCEQLADRLRLDYPEYYYRIISLFKNKNYSLKRDCYSFLNPITEKTLITRYNNLKNNALCLNTIINSNKKKSFKSIDFFSALLLNAIQNAKTNRVLGDEKQVYSKQIRDAKIFEKKLSSILNETFAHYPDDFLYLRDIKHTEYYEKLFKESLNRDDVLIIADNIIETINTKFNWAIIDPSENSFERINEILNADSSQFTVIVIPECDTIGYSLATVDELDCHLLKNLKEEISIKNLLIQAKFLFDPKELEECFEEFEQLILGRIKMFLQSKIIKVV